MNSISKPSLSNLLQILIWPAAIGLVLILGYSQNAHFYEFDRDYDQMMTQTFVSPGVRLGSLDSSGVATSQYRQSTDRTGVASAQDRPSAPIQIDKQLRPLNVDIHTASKASPAIDETGLYIGSDSGWFWKLNHEGESQWSLYLPGSDNGIHGTAALDDKKVYVGAYNGFLYALSKESGEMIWAAPVGNYIGASPLLAEGGLFIAVETYHPDGYLVRVDVNTGETLWTSEWFRGHSHSSPSYDSENKALIVGANSGRVFSIDAKTGKTNWQVQLGGPVKGTPLIWEGKAFLSSWDKHYYALDLKTGATVWKVFVGGRNQSSLSLVPGLGLGLAPNKVGDIMALDLKTGEFVWRLRHGDPNHQFSVLITEDPKKAGRYLAWSRCKEFQLCVLDAATGKLLQNLDLPGSFTSVPVAHRDRLYISLDKDAGLLILK